MGVHPFPADYRYLYPPKKPSIMPRTRLTGFSRLLIFLIIFLPLAYFGASYYNGEDPVARIKSMFGGTTQVDSGNDDDRSDDVTYDPEGADRPATFENVTDMRREIKALKAQLSVAEEKLARCEASNVD